MTSAVVRLVLSSSVDERDVDRAYALGAVGHIVKELETCPDLARMMHAFDEIVVARRT